MLTVGLAAVLARRDVLAQVGPLVPEVILIVMAAAIGFTLGVLGRRRPDDDASAAVLPATASPVEAETEVGDAGEQRAVLTFARHLLEGTARGDIPMTVETQLPTMINGRKVWIASEGRPSRFSAEPPKPAHAPVLSNEIQEWTTFALRLEEQRLGLLGIESPGGLAAAVRQRVQALTPLIAQALKTAHEVDTFREASVVDLLTGTATRREGLNRLQAEVKRAQRTGSTMAVLMIDLDYFKSVNDRFGHAVGDELLTAIGQTMHRTLRASDVRCRWGGEEFLIVLPDTTLAQAQVVATHLLQNLAATSIASAKGPVSSTASIGLTIARPAETDISRIVGRADMALYQAKHAGRSCIRVVLGGFDGEPVGMDTPPRKPTAAASETLPFPDRRRPGSVDRRKVPGAGRRRTDRLPAGTMEASRLQASGAAVAARG